MASFNQAQKTSDENEDDVLNESIGNHTMQNSKDQLDDFCGFDDTEQKDKAEDSLNESIGNHVQQTSTDQLDDFCGFADTEGKNEATTDKNICTTPRRNNEISNRHDNENEQASGAELRVAENMETSTGNRLPVTPTMTTPTNAIMPSAPRARRIRRFFVRRNNPASIIFILRFYYI
uniref:Uncharacterized protein n=1 Tax=Glossina palpalis gambiensis TaxID=67801 RepID=A0A1B0BPS8_9MUSC